MATFNWTDGSYRADDAAKTDARIIVTSDWAPITNGPFNTEEWIARDPAAIYGDLMPVLRRADLRLVNVECALGDRGTKICKAGPNMRYVAGSVAGLTSVPYHVACLGNNHVFDYGAEGYAETVRLLREAGLQTVGAGDNLAEATRTLVAKAGQARVAIVNFCEGEDSTGATATSPGTFGWDVELAERRIREARDLADVVLVVIHAGREHTPLPPPYIVRAYRRLAEAGATAVLAHHPHVPQGVEVHAGVPIAYSMGNFFFYDKSDVFYRKSGYMVEVELSGRRLAGVRLIPYLLGDQGLQLMKGEMLRWFLGQLQRVSEPMADPAKVDDVWAAFIELRKEAGFERIIQWSFEAWAENRPLAAARLRNLFLPPAQRELWIDGMTRIVEGRWGQLNPWAAELVTEWITTPRLDVLNRFH
jgi:poly-gamma-glutamate synthesis protein (capsule biosynthesis protein)